jgi:drug/metabolite transporter superfamily protein YnfA
VVGRVPVINGVLCRLVQSDLVVGRLFEGYAGVGIIGDLMWCDDVSVVGRVMYDLVLLDVDRC